MDYLDEMEKSARARNIPVILRDSREFLEKLCRERAPKRILEIGMAIGYSGSCMLRSCEAQLFSMEASTPNIKEARDNFEKLGLSERVTIIEGDCMLNLPKLAGEKFDLIFLDGPKGKYVEMLDLVLPLLSEDGVLVSDNVLFRGMVLDGKPVSEPRFERTAEVMREYIKRLTTNPELETNLYHIGDGLCVTKYK